jgi:hypothetical protein
MEELLRLYLDIVRPRLFADTTHQVTAGLVENTSRPTTMLQA